MSYMWLNLPTRSLSPLPLLVGDCILNGTIPLVRCLTLSAYGGWFRHDWNQCNRNPYNEPQQKFGHTPLQSTGLPRILELAAPLFSYFFMSSTNHPVLTATACPPLIGAIIQPLMNGTPSKGPLAGFPVIAKWNSCNLRWLGGSLDGIF